MREGSKYRAAHTVSSDIKKHFTKLLATARQKGDMHVAPEPEEHIIETIIDAAFWASLRREEGHPTRISLAYMPPSATPFPLLFAHKLPLSPEILTKLSPGIERSGVYLGVWHENNELYVWGTTRKIPNFCFVIDVSEPGLLVVKHQRVNGFGKFTNVAVFTGDEVKVIDEHNTNVSGCPQHIRSLLGLHTDGDEPVNALIQMAVSMRNHKRGGTMLVVPSGSNAWRESIIHPIKYSVTPAYIGLAELMKKEATERNQSPWQAAFRNELESIAGLTAVDGATVISDQYELLAFGAKIARLEGNTRVEEVFMHEPVMNNQATVVNPAQSGGTRHLSAAQFVHDQHDALALVASQDGRFTVYAWHPMKAMVQAYRIDTLLL